MESSKARYVNSSFPAMLCLFLIIALSFNVNNAVLKKDEALKAFNYLNTLRQNPDLVKSETGVKDKSIKKITPLQWNEILAKVAEAKALDMAENNYFSHVDKQGNGINIKIHQAGYQLNPDWIKNKRYNYFESLSAGIDVPEEAIRDLIVDEHLDPPGHRYHLLGIGDFNKDCFDCGIGIAYKEGTKYSTYMVVIIAKHNY
jgi:uncharacterized protein YkwD